jgi:hypothetical protein
MIYTLPLPRRRDVLWIAAVLLPFLLIGCSTSDETSDSRAREIIQQARQAHGSDRLENAEVTFDFRGARFTVRHDDGLYRYERSHVDSRGRNVREVLSNDSLYREVNGGRQNLSETERLSVETTVNSVVYFALLPYNLSDPAVQPRHLGTAMIRGEPYHEIEVTFRKEGGGRDWEDRFVYWIHRNRHTMDYLAYYFHTDGGGSRFREAVNIRRVNGVRFADYINYTAPSDTLGTVVEQYDRLFENGVLEKVSEIRTNNITVERHD